MFNLCCLRDVIFSVGRFSNADPVLYPVLKMNENQLTLLNVRTGMKTASGSHMTENRTGSLIELRSSSHSSLYHLLVPLVLLLTCDCYSSPVAIFFPHCSYSIPVGVTFLTWCRSFHVMKSF